MCIYLVGPLVIAGGPSIPWKPYSPEIMEQARNIGKPVILDFSADWCTPCREMEHVTFRDPEIVKQTERFIMVRADLTTKGDPALERLVREYSVRGVPTVIFLDRNGKELPELRVGQFVPADQFLSRMVKVGDSRLLIHKTWRCYHAKGTFFPQRPLWKALKAFQGDVVQFGRRVSDRNRNDIQAKG